MNKFANRLIGVLLLAYPTMLSWEYGFFDSFVWHFLMDFIVVVGCAALFVGCVVTAFNVLCIAVAAVWGLIVHGELK